MRVALANARPSVPRGAGARQPPIITPAALARALGAVLSRLDAGWLFLLAGLALLAAVTLIPAQMQLAEAQRARDNAAVAAIYETQRLARASDFLDQLRAGDPALLEALALDQLRQAPVGKTAIEPYAKAASAGGPLAWIEPAPMTVNAAAAPPPASMLARLATNDRVRLLTMALAAALVFAGLLPPAINRTGQRRSGGAFADLALRPRRRRKTSMRVDLTGARWRQAGFGQRRTPGCFR